jgi:hypothetical protein
MIKKKRHTGTKETTDYHPILGGVQMLPYRVRSVIVEERDRVSLSFFRLGLRE